MTKIYLSEVMKIKIRILNWWLSSETRIDQIY